MVDKKQLSKAFSIFMLVFGFGYAFYNFIVTINGYIKIEKHKENIDDLSHDWNLNAFTNFEVVS